MDPMQDMAVDCSWADAQLEDDAALISLLPTELLGLIRNASSGSEYLEAVASATLLPRATDKLSAYYGELLPEITARWLRKVNVSPFADHVLMLSSLAKILPFAPYLRPHVNDLISRSHGLSSLANSDTDLSGLDHEHLYFILLAFFRLFTYDILVFRPFIHPAFLSSLFKHESLPIRFLAIQCFSQVMGFADAFTETLTKKYIGEQGIRGSWEGTVINFRILKLLEERRWTQQEALLNSLTKRPRSVSAAQQKTLRSKDLLPETANLGGVLFPRTSTSSSTSPTLVITPMTLRSLRGIGHALLKTKSILLNGEPGSGKTSLVLEAARELNKSSSLITLYLNEQTDAKSLLGMYTSSEQTGSFVWQPGVLTQAIREGRWILIEDIDKAPAEVLGMIKPILQDGELYLPSRKEIIRAADGFRIFATVRKSGKSSNASSHRNSWILNDSSWSMVDVATPDHTEIRDILAHKFPALDLLIPSIMDVHRRVELEFNNNHALRSTTARSASLRDLLKWCRRTLVRLQSSAATLGTSISEGTKLDIFRDAVDCYAGHLSAENSWSVVTDCIAEQMHIAPQQVQHCLKGELPKMSETKSDLLIGRATLQKSSSTYHKPKRLAPFAFTREACMTMGKIAAATSESEPVLLVGETGVGKTTLVQHIAGLLGHTLTVVNLSQQSEASDLLGGLKPVITRSLMIPVVDIFTTLFDDTFSAKKNEKFLLSIRRYVARENWQRVLVLWQQAVQMAETSLQMTPTDENADVDPRKVKRRKLDTPKYQGLRDRWASFSRSLGQLRVQVDRAERHLTFAYVEGRIVKAVREGGWLLLDEINLASSDTLDSIASLLTETDQERPYLHLTEAGDVERVVAHPDFRVFAAMNPATDTGKKDLAPGIRSRFTELYVHPGDSDAHDLVNLIETYLDALLDSDKRAAFDLANLYLAVKALNQEHRIVDGAEDDPHFTIRSLVRCLLYVQRHTAAYGLRRAIFEGANMSFCTVLSRESERMVLPLIDQHILSGVKNVRAFLAQNPRPPSDGVEYVSFKHHLVMKGSDDTVAQPHYIRTPSVERNLLNLARATSMHRFPILLQGPTSSGKTSMVEYLAKSTGNRFVRVNNHEHTDLQEYLGSYASNNDGRLEFREGVLVQALRRGHWIVLDELNLAPSDVLEALNRLLDDNRELLIPETQEVVRPHPGFMLFATQNPAGLYGGRKRLSRAFRNRFLELHFDDIPEDELEVILQKRSQIPPSFCTQIVAVYKKLALQRQSSRLFEQQNSFATLRDLFRWATRPMDDRTQLATQGFMLLGERVRDAAERQIVKDTIEEVIRVKIDLSTLYSHDQIPSSVSKGPVVWTPAMRRLFVLVAKALQNNEPVLLVGETGCGKTQICQTVAEAFHNHLNVYNAHTNTETGDLIGSQRPARNRTETDKELRRQILAVLEASAQDLSLEEESLDALILKFEQLEASTVHDQILSDTRISIARHKSLFEWVDGILVRAMKNGQHFLLDEISLAEDSVLERLNSVLEPSRTILLAEKGPTDNHVVGEPGFQFLATMNPGGDYGKRELSAALRNRLTEIWVPPLAEADDVLPILESKLRPELLSQANVMLDFSGWFRRKFLGATVEAVPLRDLIAWADFVQQNPQLDANTALFHGAAMVFVDSLGANPAGIMSSAITNAKDARAVCMQKLGEVTATAASSIYDQELTLALTKESLRVGHFQIQRTETLTESTGLVFDAPTTLKNTMRLVRALQMKRPILLEGSPGVGKTAIVTALTQAVGKQLTRINLSDQTDLMDLFGADVPMENEDIGKFAWSDGPLLQAMQIGGWVLLDEMNLASQSVLEGLNSCLDHRQEVFIAELDRTFPCHPDFQLFAAQNPHHQGGGRKGLPKSFVNRFTVVYADPFEKDDLYQICGAKFPGVETTHMKAVVDVICEIQKSTERDPRFAIGGPWEFNLRDVTRWLEMLEKTPSLSPHHYFAPLVSQRLRSLYQKELATGICEQFLGTGEEASLYHSLSPGIFQVGTAFFHRDKSWQKIHSNGHVLPMAMLPYAQSIIEAINRRWPVIIAESAQRSSAALIRHLAALAGARVTTVSLNADTDTMDLVGGLEQHDPQQDLIAAQTMLQQVIDEELLTNLTQNNSAALIELLHLRSISAAPDVTLKDLQVHLSEISRTFDDLKLVSLKIEQILPRQQIGQEGFVWNDGVLVDALQEGRWLVLENANTCNPAVLDRLNSLLEPNGVLIVSEQHNSAGSSRTIKPHPNFRIFLTMDPRHGELSRAMRNRSLELYIDEIDIPQTGARALGYPCAADIYRIRHLEKTGVNDVELSMQPFVVSTWMNHLSQADHDLLEDSLVVETLPTFDRRLITAELKARGWLTPAFQAHTNVLRLQLLDQAKLSEHLVVSYLPLPAVDEPLLVLCSDRSMKGRVGRHAWTTQVLLRIYAVLENVSQATERSRTVHRNDQNLLEKSLVQGQQKSTGHLPLANFLVAASTALRRVIEHEYSLSHETDPDFMRYIETVLAFVNDILLLSGEAALRPGLIPAYLQNGYAAMNKATNRSASLRDEISLALELFAQDTKLKTGRSLHIMWPDLRPVTASTYPQLHNLLRLEALLERMDGLSISAGSLANVIKVKDQLTELYGSVLAGNRDDKAPFDLVDDQIVELESSESDVVNGSRLFTGAFKAILQLLWASNLPTSLGVVSSLAKAPTSLIEIAAAGRQIPQAFAAILGMIGGSSLDKNWDAWRDNFGIAIVHKIAEIEEQPLSSMDWTCIEVKTLLQSFSLDNAEFSSDTVLTRLRRELLKIVNSTLSLHRDFLKVEEQNVFAQGNGDGLEPPFSACISPDNDFRTIYQDYFHCPITWLNASLAPNALQQTGAAFVAVSLGLLRLLVPDQPYDPALTSQVAYTQYNRRSQEIKNMLAAQQNFELTFTAQTTNLLIRMTEEELRSIGEEPPVASVVRPPANGLDLLTVEFTNLLRSIVHIQPEKVLLADLPGHWQNEAVSSNDIRVEVNKLLQTIEKVLKRLKLVDRALDDLTKPVIWIFQCLALGAQMLLAHHSSSSRTLKRLRQHIDGTTLIGSSPKRIMNSPLFPIKDSTTVIQDCFDWLEHFALEVSIEEGIILDKPRKKQDLLKVTDMVYETWRGHLEKDQEAAVARSKYYAYRGDEDMDESQEKQAVAQMFPTFDDTGDTATESMEAPETYDAGAIAVRLARLQQQIFSGAGGQANMEIYIDRSLEILTKEVARESFELGPVPSQDLMPAILLQLDRTISFLEATEGKERLNIYTDGDVVEARILYDLVKTIMSNFRRIQAAWPEHAVPAEVCSCCKEILRFTLKDPVAKLLTKTEKLLDIVSQWQAVTSREYSATDNVDELTKLIIRWRKLELSSWSRLLDLEQHKVEENACSWYFMLYEAIISNPRQLLDQKGDLLTYLTELARTLEDFLTSSSVGEFSCRLQLCRSFERMLTDIIADDPMLRPLHDCVTSTIRHHERFEQTVVSTLARGRTELEKKLREQIKLASWKDTNASALRESARRTHFKLFKIVRKYRALLSKPLQPQSTTPSYEDQNAMMSKAELLPSNIPTDAVESALQVAAGAVSDWSSRPERLQNPLGAAARMKLLVRRPGDVFVASAELSSITTSLQVSIKDLRSRTPTTLTEDSQSLVNHLKVLKQTLFSDTLRYIKQMGVRRDLGVLKMEKQSSRAMVLATAPGLESGDHPQMSKFADKNFHEILDLMPAVRRALTEHSEQVRVADIRRSVSYAEGFLSILIQQRQVIAVCDRGLNVYGTLTKKLSIFTQQPTADFQHASAEFRSRQSALIARLCWLPELLALTAKVLQVQMKYSKYKLTGLIDSLHNHRQKFKDFLAQTRDLALLPAGLRLKNEVELTTSISDFFDDLRQDLQDATLSHPQSATVLNKLFPWTDMTIAEAHVAVNGLCQLSLDELDHGMRQCLEHIFEAVQLVSSYSERLPDSTEVNGWLAKTNKRQAEMLESLQVIAIAEQLGKVEANLGHLSHDSLSAGISLIITALPIIEQYLLICQYVIGQALALHCETAKMTVVLTRTLTTIASEGFCSPSEKPEGQEQSGPVESGTGLGDGTGADDISKDVADDEDLSEFAQAENEKPEDSELEASKDAVNMDKDELQGDDGGAEESAAEEDARSQSGDEEGSDLDEETGSVDDLDPSAVDEKMWEGLDAENDKELEIEKAQGEKSDEQTAKLEKQGTENTDKQDKGDEEEAEDSASSSEDEGEGVGRDEIDKADPNVQEEKTLELPDEMQLNGEENADRDETSDDDRMADLSDVENEADPGELKEADLDNAHAEDNDAVKEDTELSDEFENEDQTGQADEDEVMDDQPEPDLTDEEHDHDTRNDDMTYDVDKYQAVEMGEGGAVDEDENATELARENTTTRKSDQTQDHPQDDTKDNENDKGNDETGGVTHGGKSEVDVASQQAEALKKLGDILEQWHQRREIHQATQDHTEQTIDDIDMAAADFEHLQNEIDQGDAQALGEASKDQAQTLDQSKAIEDDNVQGDPDQAPADVAEQDQPVQESMVERFSQLQTNSEMEQDSGPGAIMPENKQKVENGRLTDVEHSLDKERDTNVVNDHLASTAQDSLMSQADASQLWSHYSAKVQQISLILTEQLRLILAPTLATKLRGDFRTGKRLNVKRIIPYIASGYKRDKIWMRRSVPSKRNYQIMLALDDSKSMMEGGAGVLAFETLAMLSKSLSMLEVGDLCVVGFGNEEHIRVAHPFGQPFGNEAGVGIFQNFSFNQTATDVRKMIKESIALFQDARAKSTGSQSELWQLQLIISDGICEDHESVSRLVRQAKEEKIMIVFVIVDGRGRSILDLTQASFEPDESGEMKLSMRRYLERFPFPYYLVVRDVRDLPGVLATALKGWFAQVVDVNG
jgi:midasin